MGNKNESGRFKKNKKKNDVFYFSLILTVIILFISLFAKNKFNAACESILGFLLNSFGWFYLLGVFFIVVTIVYLFFSKYGDIKLGHDDSEPEFSTFSWIAMLFAAGMGTGLVFWGVAEPLCLYYDPPPIGEIIPQTVQAANASIEMSFFHWGIHPWCVYSLLGILLAYSQYRKGEKGLISRVFIPIFGRNLIKGWLGKLIDICTVVATIAGLVTTLGLCTLQISRGLHYLYGIEINNYLIFVIILIITIFYMSSAIFGLEKGIKTISNFNLVLAICLLILIIIIGPTTAIFNTLTNGLGDYLSDFIKMSLTIKQFGNNTWTAKWTIFMWATWIAWAPLVATFIARVSKGRTIKEFILGVVLVPSLISVIWFSAFGALGLNVADAVGEAAVKDPALTLFMVLNHYPIGKIISFVSIILLTTFFITSADSAVFVLGILTTHGNLNPKTGKKIVWGLLISGLAFCIIRAGGLDLVKNISIIGAFPFLIFLLISILALLRHLYLDRKTVRKKVIKRIIYKDKNISDIENI